MCSPRLQAAEREIIATNLPKDQEEKLRKAFAA
jgi:uncharacterized membrane protein